MPEDALSDPAWFPDRLDWHNRLVRLVRVRRETLRDSAFLDGRTPLTGDGDSRTIDLDAFIAAAGGGNPAPIGWIFHESFCGSTQLARILTVDGVALCLREPQLLVDLAGWRAGLLDGEQPLYRAALRAGVAKLAQRWTDGERIAIKPSNWGNTIAADLLAASAASGASAGAAYIEIAAEPFLVAVLRGGAERIRYVLRLHMHLVKARPALRAELAPYLEDAADEAASMLRHIAATHWMQRQLREEIAAVAPSARLSFPAWPGDPIAAASAAADALGLMIPPDALARSVRDQLGIHSKTPGEPYARAAEEAGNAAIRAAHGPAIARALEALGSIVGASQ